MDSRKYGSKYLDNVHQLSEQKKHPFYTVASILLCFLMLTGCMNDVSGSKNAESDLNEEVVIGAPDASSWENVHNLSADGSVKITDSIESKELFLMSESVYTNSHKVSVTNNSGVDVVVYLYSASDLSDPVRQMTVNDGETESFSGLTSRFAYNIGVETTASTSLNITIAD